MAPGALAGSSGLGPGPSTALDRHDQVCRRIIRVIDVHLAPESGHPQCKNRCPLCANSGHHRIFADPNVQNAKDMPVSTL